MTKETIKNAVLAALWNFEKSGYTNEELADHVAWLLTDESTPATKPDTRHRFTPDKKYPWFCSHCGYPPEHPVMHLPAAASLDSENEKRLASADEKLTNHEK